MIIWLVSEVQRNDGFGLLIIVQQAGGTGSGIWSVKARHSASYYVVGERKASEGSKEAEMVTRKTPEYWGFWNLGVAGSPHNRPSGYESGLEADKARTGLTPESSPHALGKELEWHFRRRYCLFARRSEHVKRAMIAYRSVCGVRISMYCTMYECSGLLRSILGHGIRT